MPRCAFPPRRWSFIQHATPVSDTIARPTAPPLLTVRSVWIPLAAEHSMPGLESQIKQTLPGARPSDWQSMSKCRFAAPSTGQAATAALRCPWKGLSGIGQSGPSKFLDTWSKKAGPLHNAAGLQRTKSRRINLACDPSDESTSSTTPRRKASSKAVGFLVSPCGQILARSPWTKDHNRYHTSFFYNARPTWLPGEFRRFRPTPSTS